MARKWSADVVEGVAVLIVLGLLFVAGTAGFIIGRSSTEPDTTTATTSPAGHTGAGLPAHEFGDAARGAMLFESKGCADCHSYGGKGGTDAPPLDYMSGHLSANEVADLSGQIWNHLPAMLMHFEEEGLTVPTFREQEMADLVAYLHSRQETTGG